MTNIWEKFDKSIDTEGLKKDVAEAAEGKSGFAEIPVGKYEVKVILMELTESKKGAPMLTMRFQILTGDFKGSLIFYNQVINSGFGIHNANQMLGSLGSATEAKFENFKQYNDLILDLFTEVDGLLEYLLDYSKNKKDFNVYKIEEIFDK